MVSSLFGWRYGILDTSAAWLLRGTFGPSADMAESDEEGLCCVPAL